MPRSKVDYYEKMKQSHSVTLKKHKSKSKKKLSPKMKEVKRHHDIIMNIHPPVDKLDSKRGSNSPTRNIGKQNKNSPRRNISKMVTIKLD
tara:strand:- start:616 stop:885 length:270 start_codon:yes stop_codon:yes gene_type:complete